VIPFQERKKLRKILYSKYTLVVLLLVLVWVAKGAWGVHQKAKIAISERDIVQHSFDDLTARTTELNASLDRIKSQKGIEEEVRQKYTVARPG
jgi:cell division protein FtsB